MQSTASKNIIPYLSPLESHNGIPKNKGPIPPQEVFWHKSLRSTEIYINIEQTIFEPSSDEFTVKVVDKPEEAKALLEVGFEYVCQKGGCMHIPKKT